MKIFKNLSKVNPAKEVGKLAGATVSGLVGGVVSGVFGEETPEEKQERLRMEEEARIRREELERIEEIKWNRQVWLLRFLVAIECVIVAQFILVTGIENASFEVLWDKRSIVLVLPVLGWVVASLFINKTRI